MAETPEDSLPALQAGEVKSPPTENADHEPSDPGRRENGTSAADDYDTERVEKVYRYGGKSCF